MVTTMVEIASEALFTVWIVWALIGVFATGAKDEQR